MATRVTADHLRSLNPRRVCLIKPSAFGDVVQSLPVALALKQRFEDLHLAWVINRGLHPLIESQPCVDEVLLYPRRGGWGSQLRFLAALRKRQFDLVIDLQGLLRTGLMSLACRSPLRVGLQTAREGSHLAYSYSIPDTGREVPAWKRYLIAADAFAVSAPPANQEEKPSGGSTAAADMRSAGHWEARPYYQVAAADAAWCRQTLNELPRPWLTIHPGARWVTKRWHTAGFAEVATRFQAETRGTVLVVGTDDERHLGQQVVDRCVRSDPQTPVRNLSGQTQLGQLAAILQASDVVLSNDSGPMHLAAAVGTTVVGLFTCTSPVRSGPPGPGHRLLAAPVDCAASYLKKCPHRGALNMCCLDAISVDRVTAAVLAAGPASVSRRSA